MKPQKILAESRTLFAKKFEWAVKKLNKESKGNPQIQNNTPNASTKISSLIEQIL